MLHDDERTNSRVPPSKPTSIGYIGFRGGKATGGQPPVSPALERAHGFDSVALYRSRGLDAGEAGAVERLDAQQVTPSFRSPRTSCAAFVERCGSCGVVRCSCSSSPRSTLRTSHWRELKRCCSGSRWSSRLRAGGYDAQRPLVDRPRRGASRLRNPHGRHGRGAYRRADRDPRPRARPASVNDPFGWRNARRPSVGGSSRQQRTALRSAKREGGPAFITHVGLVFRLQRWASAMPSVCMPEDKRFVYILRNADPEPHFYVGLTARRARATLPSPMSLRKPDRTLGVNNYARASVSQRESEGYDCRNLSASCRHCGDRPLGTLATERL